MKTLKALILAATLMASTGAAPVTQGMTQPPLDDPEATVVEGLVIRASQPGPAWWTVSDGDTKVYVLGVLSGLPKTLSWDQTVLDRRLDGASVLILPPTGNIGRIQEPGGIDLEAGLPRDLAKRFEAQRNRLIQLRSRYAGMSPLWAGVALVVDFREKADARRNQPEDDIVKAGRRANVPVRRARAVIRADRLRAARMSDELVCLDQALDEVEAGEKVFLGAMRAWTEGDVKGALTAGRGADLCLLALRGGAGMVRDSHGSQVAAITDALAKPGKAVAALPLRSLVAEGGVLEQLQAKGFTVETPAALD